MAGAVVREFQTNFEFITYDTVQDGRIAVITLNRPRYRNAMVSWAAMQVFQMVPTRRRSPKTRVKDRLATCSRTNCSHVVPADQQADSNHEFQLEVDPHRVTIFTKCHLAS